MIFYTNTRYPKEKVYEDEKIDWIEEHGKISFEELTSFDYEAKRIQEDIKEHLAEWFFSDWEKNKEEEQEENRQEVIADIIYQENLERKWGLS